MKTGIFNAFKAEDRDMFIWNRQTCWACGQNHADCLHHIFGRGMRGDGIHNSILNAAPLNNSDCHLYKKLNDRVTIEKFLGLTLQLLIKQNYKLKDRDNKFLEKYSEYYVSIKV